MLGGADVSSRAERSMNARARFIVEAVTTISGRGVLVLARRGDAVEFWLNASTTLDGCPVAGGDIPRALDESGKPRLDLWGFFLRNDRDREKFSVGKVVQLESVPGAT